MKTVVVNTSLGCIEITEQSGFISGVAWSKSQASEQHSESSLLQEATTQIKAYFKGELTHFTLPIKAEGTPFQQRIWDEMRKIPYGQVMTYGSVAQKIGSHARAVGSACGKNPIPVIVPCHRIVGQAGLGGFSAGKGQETKRQLLKLEGYKPS